MNTVYVARGLVSGLYKIGVTGNVFGRMVTLRRQGIGEGVVLLAAFDGSYRVESALHRRFADLLAGERGREWFRDDGRIAEWLAGMSGAYRCAVTFPYLPTSSGRRVRLPTIEDVAAAFARAA